MKLVEQTTGAKLDLDRLSFRLTRLFDLVDAGEIEDPATQTSPELLAVSGLPPAATYNLARETAGTMAWEIDWGHEAADSIAFGIREYRRETAEQLVTDILQGPSTGTGTVTDTGLLTGGSGNL
jgi:hypothetical protein